MEEFLVAHDRSPSWGCGGCAEGGGAPMECTLWRNKSFKGQGGGDNMRHVCYRSVIGITSSKES